MINPKKIILISLDTLRADHMGCYGYSRSTTPNLDRLAQESIVFKNAFSPSSHTIPSHGSIFTGKLPSRHSIGFNQNIFVETGRLDTDVDITLAEILKNSGFSTAAFISGIVLSRKTNFNSGFDTYDDEISGDPYGRRNCEATTSRAIEWLSDNYSKNFFVFLHFFDIHGPYHCPPSYEHLFLNDSGYVRSRLPERRYDVCPELDAIPNYQLLRVEKDPEGSITRYEREFGYYVAQYDSCVRYVDDSLGILFENLKKMGIYNDTLIIITSDHGEAFGENGIYFYHGLTVTPDQIKVPFIVKLSEGMKSCKSRFDEPVSTLDIFPTVLSLLEIDNPDPDIDGSSLQPFLEGNPSPLLVERTLASENECQYAQILTDGIIRLSRKEKRTSDYYPSIPELVDSLDGRKLYWESSSYIPFDIPFDEYQRYRIVADIVDHFRKDDQTFTILDVGSGGRETLKKFLPSDSITYLDKEIPERLVGRIQFLKQDITRDEISGKYDFVVSVDTFEHISVESREHFLDNILRSSNIATVLACPFDTPGVREYESSANEIYKRYNGEDYLWLKEHRLFGLPSLPVTLDLIRAKCTGTISVIPNGYLPRWFRNIKLFLSLEKKQDVLNYLSTLWEFYNLCIYRFDNRDPSYRKVIVIQKSTESMDFSDLVSSGHAPGNDLEPVLNDLILDLQKEDLRAHTDESIRKSLVKDIQQLTHDSIELNQAIREKDLEISFERNKNEILNKERNDINIHLAGMDQIVRQKELVIAELTNQVQQVEQHARGLEYRIQQEENRISRKIIGKISSVGRRGRESVDLVLKCLQILLHGGLRELLNKYHERNEFLASKKGSVSPVQQSPNWNIKDLSPSSITLPEPADQPEVSIIIPVHNQIGFTLNCLDSVAHKTKGKFEIIIVDDASTDTTPEDLSTIKNITVIRNEQNQGFIRSCNTGAATSRGKYLLFLNNDTIVTDNWLSPLIEIFGKENVGAAGSKLIYPDGRLQEAGNIIWNDATGWNYGRGDNPLKPEYNFVRPVDYCSGASLMVRKELFDEIGGFDQRYTPAYYEDADLCFSLRKRGYKVMYQPKSVVVHFEGISGGTDPTKGVKHHQVINREKFFGKWRETLQSEHSNPGRENLIRARSHTKGKSILVIDQYVPFFDRDAGSYRMSNILKILAELGHRVSFIGDNFNQFDPYDAAMQQAGVEVVYSPYIDSIPQYLSDSRNRFDIIVVSRPHVAEKYIADIRTMCPRAKIIYDTVDLAFMRETRRAEVEKDPQILIKAAEIKNIELSIARKSDVTLVVSASEQQILLREDPSLNVQIISLIHTIIEPTIPFSGRRDLFFLGAFLHNPNADAALWFIREIFPRIRVLEPGIRIFIVGDRPSKEILELSADDVIVTGYVKDLSGYFNNSRVFVAPLRYGAGVKGKINQSMSRGLPVVTTSIGAEGMGINDGEHVLVADDPDKFANDVIRLYRDEELWKKLSFNAMEHIRHNTSFEQSKVRINEFIEKL